MKKKNVKHLFNKTLFYPKGEEPENKTDNTSLFNWTLSLDMFTAVSFVELS